MKLFVINSPYWFWSMRPQGPTSNLPPKSLDPLDEHHTYFYYLFLKHRIVSEVIIYDMTRKDLNRKQNIPETIEFDEGKMIVDYDATLTELNRSSGELVYSRQVNDHFFPQHVNLIKHIEEGFPSREWLSWIPSYIPWLCGPRKVNPHMHSLFLSEGKYNQRYIRKGMPSVVWPTLSNQIQYVDRLAKKYDWIIVSSLNPRKRVIQFCNELLARNLGHLKGCILLESNKAVSSHADDLAYLQSAILPKSNITLTLDLNNAEKMKHLCESKVFLSIALRDSGPRSLVEAAQAKIPCVALKHHGCASSIIKPSINGETYWQYSSILDNLEKIVHNYESYDCSVNIELLNPDTWFRPLAKEISNQLKRVR